MLFLKHEQHFLRNITSLLCHLTGDVSSHLQYVQPSALYITNGGLKQLSYLTAKYFQAYDIRAFPGSKKMLTVSDCGLQTYTFEPNTVFNWLKQKSN